MKNYLVSSKNTNAGLQSCTTDAGYYHNVTNREEVYFVRWGRSQNTNLNLLSCTGGAGYYHFDINLAMFFPAGLKIAKKTNLRLVSCTPGATYYQIVISSEPFVSTVYEDTENTNLNLLSYTGGISYYQVVTNLVNLGHSIFPPDGALRKSNSCRILSFFHFLIPVSGRLNSPVRYVVFYYFFTHFHPGR